MNEPNLIELLAANPLYVQGLNFPLEAVAEILEQQNKLEHAIAIRVALHVIQTQIKPQ